jgi:pimeloyl-ACP methyl ester carboxylesterase
VSRRLAALLLCAAAGVAGACGGGRTAAHRTPSLDGCAHAGRSTAVTHVRAHGERLPAAVLGRGSTGVVLANESDLDLCSWLPFARALARRGSRVLLFDYGLDPPQAEVAAAARRLRALGSTRIVLAGASEGAKAAILAASSHPQMAQALVALSPERYLQGADVTPAARALRLPALFAVSRSDPYSAGDTPALERAAGSASKRLVVVPGADHGVALLHGAPAATVAAAVYDFLQPFLASRPARPSLASECGSGTASGLRARPVAFTAGDGIGLHGDVIGPGTTTVVLAHEYPSNLCGWFPYAASLVRAGDRVLVFDQRTDGDRLDLDVAAAVAEAYALGAHSVVAMGASLGGAATLIAAGRDCMLVSGIVSASGETDLRAYGGGVPPLYAVPDEPHITAPLLVVGSRGDPLVDRAAVGRLLARARSSSERAVLVPGTTHGWDLLQGPQASAPIRAAVARFIAHAGPPVPTGCDWQ